eukprot:TRINITY_DN66006_c0_g1_i1.p1 TRINITY_DN66006_c0_g1~~TRINITY_DN66006_c0_g1_i1.p1  ORF type:complete len:406 (+),score=114.54 TRINITY_DN66006_c0_g1_i1:53-1270(+)
MGVAACALRDAPAASAAAARARRCRHGRRWAAAGAAAGSEAAAWALLGLRPGASQRDLTVAYREAVKRVHPDVPTTGDADKFRAVQSAYEALRGVAGEGGAAPGPATGPESQEGQVDPQRAADGGAWRAFWEERGGELREPDERTQRLHRTFAWVAASGRAPGESPAGVTPQRVQPASLFDDRVQGRYHEMLRTFMFDTARIVPELRPGVLLLSSARPEERLAVGGHSDWHWWHSVRGAAGAAAAEPAAVLLTERQEDLCRGLLLNRLYGSDGRVRRGSGGPLEAPAVLLHNCATLPGRRRLCPGVYTGGSAAGLQAADGEVSSLLLEGACEWRNYELDRECRLGLWTLVRPGGDLWRGLQRGAAALREGALRVAASPARDLSAADRDVPEVLAELGAVTRHAWR